MQTLANIYKLAGQFEDAQCRAEFLIGDPNSFKEFEMLKDNLTEYDWHTVFCAGDTSDLHLEMVGLHRDPVIGIRFGFGDWHWYNIRYNKDYLYKFNKTCISSSRDGAGLVRGLINLWGDDLLGLTNMLYKGFSELKERNCPFVYGFDFMNNCKVA